jgi:hypothetical protein
MVFTESLTWELLSPLHSPLEYTHKREEENHEKYIVA